MSGANTFFKKNPALSGMTSYGVLKPFENLEKTNDPIPRKQSDRWADGRTDTLFCRIHPVPVVGPKVISLIEKNQDHIDQFHATGLFYPLKTSENQRFFRGYRKRPAA